MKNFVCLVFVVVSFGIENRVREIERKKKEGVFLLLSFDERLFMVVVARECVLLGTIPSAQRTSSCASRKLCRLLEMMKCWLKR